MPLGPRLRRGLAVGAAALALAPASALAQGAGDDQYSDPFGSDEQAATPTPAPRAPAATATPAPVQPAATAAPGQPAPAATPAPPGPSLPYTGFEAWLPAAGGALLLGAGLTLRARSRADERS
jgi:LPXTG-motif cell wall-anchored protein